MKKQITMYAALRIIFVMLMIMICAAGLAISLSGCDSDSSNNQQMIDPSENNNRFILLEKIGKNNTNYDVIYVDTFTGVEYFVHHEKDGNGHESAWGTVLFNADGTPMIAPGYPK